MIYFVQFIRHPLGTHIPQRRTGPCCAFFWPTFVKNITKVGRAAPGITQYRFAPSPLPLWPCGPAGARAITKQVIL